VIDSQPGKHDKKNIRETLERLAFQFLLVPKIETHVPRRENLALAEAVIKCCDRLKTLLSETNVLREGSFYTAFGSRDEYDAITNKIEELEDAARLVAANNQPLSQKQKQADPRRDRYLRALCDLWVTEMHGKPTRSYDRRTGRPRGPFVDFLVGAAQPVLQGFTVHSAHRFLKRWRPGMAV
jgi:hypothetical protein